MRDGAEARAAVREAKGEGADFIKVYSLLSREAFLAIADETQRQGLPFAGHIPLSVSAAESSNAGQGSIEHLTGVLEAASGRDEETRRLLLAALSNRGQDTSHLADIDRLVWRTYKDTFSSEKAAALMTLFKRNHTWQTPTLTLLRGQAFFDNQSLLNDPRLKYIPAGLKTAWDMTVEEFRQRTSEDAELWRWRYEKYLELVGMMERAGVPILAGTVVMNPWCLPGFSLHDELALMVQAGMTPAAALRTATINPAVFLKREADLGTVAKGKIADFVLLDANPLQDITNTTRISAVVVNGRRLDRATLDKMLSQVEAAAAFSQKAVKYRALSVVVKPRTLHLAQRLLIGNSQFTGCRLLGT